MGDRLKTLKQEHSKLLTEAQDMVRQDDAGDLEWNGEAEAKFDKLHERMATLRDEIDSIQDRREKVARAKEYEEQKEEAIVGRLAAQGFDEEQRDNIREKAEERTEQYRKAFRKYMAHGKGELSRQEMDVLRTGETEKRASDMVVGTSNLGGVFVPEEFEQRIYDTLKDFGSMRRVAEIFTTSAGGDRPVPAVDDVANKGSLVSEGSTIASVSDMKLSNVVLKAHIYQSGPITTSVELLQDSAFDMEGFIGRRIQERIGRATEKHYLDSTGGSGRPQGLLAAVNGSTATAIANGSSNLGFANLYDLKHDVDIAYRRLGAAWMMTDNSVKIVSKITDSQGQFLLQPRVTEAAPMMLLGHPVEINNSSTKLEFDEVASATSAKKVILFGNFRRGYGIRDVRGISIQRLDELFALTRQVGFVGFMRTDGRALFATTDPAQQPVRALVENT